MKIGLILIIFLAVACGGKTSENKKSKELLPICSGSKSINCLQMIDWSLEFAPVQFPKNFIVLIDNIQAAGKCNGRENVKFSFTPEGKSVMNFPFSLWPSKPFRVEIKDTGLDCKNDASFLIADQPPYSTATITINRQRFQTVYVNID